MHFSRRALVSATGLLALIGAPGICGCTPRTPTFVELLDEVRQKVERRHYSRGRDTPAWRAWRAERDYRRQQALNVNTTIEFYFNVLNPMLAVLGDAHTFTRPPAAPIPPAQARPASAATTPQPWSGDVTAGQGFSLAQSRKGLVVAQVTAGSLADQNGVEPGSIVLSYRLTPKGDQPPQLAARLALPDGGEREVRYALATLPAAPSFAVSQTPAGRTMLRFDSFSADLIVKCAPVLREPNRGLVVDLRRNGGGEIEALQKLMGAFVEGGATIATLIEGTNQTPLRARSDGPMTRSSVALLVGPITASAAEVMAAALQERRRAVVVGEPTAGSVLQARLHPLRDGGILSIAERDVLTPAGRRLEGSGVAPDQEVRQTLAAARAGRDLALEAAESRLDQLERQTS